MESGFDSKPAGVLRIQITTGPVSELMRHDLRGDMWSEGKLTFDRCFNATGGRCKVRYVGTVRAKSRNETYSKCLRGKRV